MSETDNLLLEMRNTKVNDTAKRLGERYSELTSQYEKNSIRERPITQKKQHLPPSVKQFYKNQRKLIHSFMEAENLLKNNEFSPNDRSANNMGITDFVDIFSDKTNSKSFKNSQKNARIVITVSFALNIVLFVAKIVAAAFTNSISIISSTIDSGIDIISSSITFYVNKSINKINIYKNPQGKRRLEPVGILIIACIMSVASFQVISVSIERMVTHVNLVPKLSYTSIGIIVATIVIKAGLAFFCSKFSTPSTNALMTDHLNDVITNCFSLAGFALSTYVWSYADSLFALLYSIYICISWYRIAKENVKCLTGKSASPNAIQRLTWICMHHHRDIIAIDTVRAYTFGVKYLVEVDLVLPETMPLRVAHDIGETLQQKLEALPEVERAFVHLDYESTHRPEIEHRVVCIEQD